MLYHGSPHKFSCFRSPAETGNFRPSEAGRRHHRDVVFLTNSVEEAVRYAGSEGFFYVVTGIARAYDQAGKRKPVCRDGVYVADPDEVKIVLRLKLALRRRNQPQEFLLEEEGEKS